MHFIFQGILVCMSKTEITLDVQVKALIECKRLQPLAMPDEATGGGMSLRQVAGGALLSAEVALMWRVVCTWLQVGSAASCNPVQSIPCSNSLHKPHLETYYDSPFTVASASSHMLCSGAREACCGVAPGRLTARTCNALTACRRKGAPRGRQPHLPAGLGRKSRLSQLLSISKRWSSCSQSQPRHCCRQLPRRQLPAGSMPLHAGSC